ncbi:MAG: hypothetical protein CVV27_16770 [Candidatus Melainabacteria bacterium HGW-Melainabacteria-1]|nr:MAG: hypothetical protein CVV27_16770 [Candidatus Melainabacteria bacterium HGW-Melainabacteria-1]
MKPFIAVCLLVLNSLCLTGFFPLLPNAAVAQEASLPIAVLGISAKGNIGESEASILTDRIRTLVVQSRRFQVMERESMDKILREQGFQTTQDCESNACSVEIGRLLSVRGIITGSISRIGNLYSLNLRVIDVERGTILKEEYVDCNCSLEHLLIDKIPPLVSSLLGISSASQVSNQPQSQPSNQPPNLLPSPEPSVSARPDVAESLMPIRRRKPFLVSLEGGYLNFLTLALQYNYNEYGAFRLSGSYGQGFYRYYDANFGSYTASTITPGLNIGARIYFSDQDFAGFGEVLYTVPNVLSPRLGIESRSDSGFTWQFAGGWAFSGDGSTLDTMASIGYAF